MISEKHKKGLEDAVFDLQAKFVYGTPTIQDLQEVIDLIRQLPTASGKRVLKAIEAPSIVMVPEGYDVLTVTETSPSRGGRCQSCKKLMIPDSRLFAVWLTVNGVQRRLWTCVTCAEMFDPDVFNTDAIPDETEFDLNN